VAGRAEIIPPGQGHRTQNGKEAFGTGSGRTGLFAAGAGKDGGGVLLRLVQVALENPGRHFEGLTSQGLLQTFQIENLPIFFSKKAIQFG
jgi:hypothetical protein